jgi:hypothetical protein
VTVRWIPIDPEDLADYDSLLVAAVAVADLVAAVAEKLWKWRTMVVADHDCEIVFRFRFGCGFRDTAKACPFLSPLDSSFVVLFFVPVFGSSRILR